MAKIDLDKLICSLAKRKYFSEEKLQGALKEQDLEYKDGEIVEIQKPKFKIGDWIVNNKHKDVFFINNITSRYCILEDTKGIVYQPPLPLDENDYHLWTIDDAKEGDVLATDDDNICVFDGTVKDGKYPFAYCGLTRHRFEFYDRRLPFTHDNIHPATIEQRNLLFSKMKEAGYEWDADKKELKKIGDSVEKALRKAGYEWSEETHQLKKIENTRPMLSDFFNTEYERGKGSFANRQLYNRAILKILSDYIEKYPDTRFGQMLYNLGIGPVFNEESQEIYLKLDETINKQNHE